LTCLTQLAGEQQPPWIIYSSLAEGADRLVVERVSPLSGAVDRAVTPGRRDYIQDFSGSESVFELTAG